MQIFSAEYRNYCQHEKLALTFHPGTNVIVGPNGCGKSNLVGGIYFAFAGESQNAGVKTADVRFGSAERALVAVNFRQGTHDYELTRSIVPKEITSAHSQTLRGGGLNLRSAKEINLALNEMLGASTATLSDRVFIQQARIDAFVSKTETDRSKELARITGADEAAKRYDLLTKEIAAYTLPCMSEDDGALQAGLAEAQQACKVTEAEIADTFENAPVNIDEALTSHDSAIKAINAYRQQQQAAADTTAAFVRAETNYAAIHTERVAAETQYAEAKNVLAELTSRYGDVASQLTAWTTYNTTLATQQRAAALWQQHYASFWKRASRPRKPFAYTAADYQAATKRAAELSTEKTQLTGLLNALHPGATGSCSLCGTPVAEILARKDSIQARLAAAVAELTPLQAKVVQAMTYENALRTYTTQVTRVFKQRAEEERKRREQLAPLTPPLTTEVLLIVADKELTAAREALATRTTTFTNCKQREEAAFKVRNQAQVAMNVANTTAGADSPCKEADPDLVIAQHNKEISRLAAIKVLREAAQKRLVAQQSNVSAWDARLAEFQTGLAKYRQHSAWREYCDRLRAPFHREAAAKMLSYTCLEKSQQGINAILSQFLAPFRVVADDTLGFTAVFADGKEQPGERLSGGQKFILALAYHITMNGLFVPKVQVLSLDEPTAYLDQENMGRLEGTLTQLQQHCADSGLQVFFVTHETSLMGLFDKVIDLGA